MADDPSLVLQGRIVAAVKVDSALTAMIGGRIHDHVPQNVAFPFVQIDDVQIVDDGVECADNAVEIFLRLQVWSRPSGAGKRLGSVEVKTICQALRQVLHATTPDLSPDWRCVALHCRDTIYRTEPDGLTERGMMNFRALVDPVA